MIEMSDSVHDYFFFIFAENEPNFSPSLNLAAL